MPTAQETYESICYPFSELSFQESRLPRWRREWLRGTIAVLIPPQSFLLYKGLMWSQYNIHAALTQSNGPSFNQILSPPNPGHHCGSPSSLRFPCSLLSTQRLASWNMLVAGWGHRGEIEAPGRTHKEPWEGCPGTMALPPPTAPWSLVGPRGWGWGAIATGKAVTTVMPASLPPSTPSRRWPDRSAKPPIGFASLLKKEKKNSCKLNNPCVGFGRCYS